MAKGSDIAARLPATHTLLREHMILEAFELGQFVPITWTTVPISHRFQSGTTLRGTLEIAERVPQLGELGDSFRPNVSQLTAQRIADELVRQSRAGAPDGVVLPTAKIMDAAFAASTLTVDPCLQTADAHMMDTDRMLRHSREVDKSMAGRAGRPSTEGKGWCNTNRLVGHPELEANYGLYADGALYRSVMGYKLWQPGPGLAHFSGYGSVALPQGYTDYSQVLASLVRRTMWVEGRGDMDILDVAKDPILAWLISTEGPVIMRHPGVDQQTPATAPAALLTRTLRLRSPYMTGEDVRFVQAIVGAQQDGVFGPNTEGKVKAWQRGHKDALGRPLLEDGVVGPATAKAMLASIGVQPQPGQPSVPAPYTGAYDPHKASYREAMHYNRTVLRDTVHWVVLHSAEAAEKPGTAEGLQAYFALMPDGRQVSAHWSFDTNSGCKSVPEERIAYHANKANRYGVGYEHAGYARQSRAEWLDDYGEGMLAISAATAAKITCPRWQIPPDNVVDAAGLKRAYVDFIDKGKPVPNELRGFTTHHAVTVGLGGTHWDPGPNWPMDRYLGYVAQAA